MKDYQKHINELVLPKVQKHLGLKNVMQTPKIIRINVNVGIGARVQNSKDFSDVVENITAITGQKPIIVNSKKAISNFKLREGTPNGVTATLRKKKMLDFFNRMVNVAFPRIRDFQGFSEKTFDGHGNLSIGIKDCSIFPEVNPDDLSNIHGLSITIVTSAKDDDSAKELLKALNFPFKKELAPAEHSDEVAGEQSDAGAQEKEKEEEEEKEKPVADLSAEAEEAPAS